ncbi:dihydrolipoamide acetyltransferase family protein [Enterocloster bolteae]|uniref:dihydrolipoamide acetyltransferase family protein n=1 Tax=Enterocloster bolteae TaxID=208479 RepID=UPI000E437A63|nr:dihydrolipoamide acetyltransferase family protein [Enterocloster bolteae]RGK75316.1 2-oxo acid dehydrogenase subunit E2 [Enterocloster bolteae]
MVTKVIMPKFGLSMETGVLGSWLVEEGDSVTKGSALAEITTDKITNTCEAPKDGILRKILLPEGEEAACGEAIAVLADTADEDISAECGGGQSEGGAFADSAEQAAAASPVPEKAASADIKITPRAKKVAEEQGLEYSHIQGTGLLGAITISDLKKHGIPRKDPAGAASVSAAPASASVPSSASGSSSASGPSSASAPASGPSTASAPAAAPKAVFDTRPCEGEDVIVKMSTMETAIAKAMQNSLLTTAQATIATEAEITELVRVYKQLKGKYTNAGVKLSYTAMLIKAVAMALENHKALRSTMADETHIKISSRIHIGVAVDIPGGLIVPVIRDANMKDLRTICLELSDLTQRAKDNKLTSDQLGGATITITNLGMFGITYFTPVLNVPESAILGVGAIIEKLMVKDGGFYPASVMNFSLTHDHRIVNGAPAARFLKEVTASLQDFKWV